MSTRQEVRIPVQPWYRDHFFNGITILPAVEIMLILAQTVKDIFPDCPIQQIQDARFASFLQIPEDCSELAAIAEYEQLTKDSIRIRLFTRIQLKTMSRMKLHAELTFCTQPLPKKTPSPALQESATATVSAARIYRELVPFGPAYHSLRDHLQLTEDSAHGNLLAPDFPQIYASQHLLGSPFPLDGAMHAACVLGQCSTDFVPFPVGFARRTVYNPTRAGREYNTEVTGVSGTEDELICDLSIFDTGKQLCESIRKLCMRDVSGGRLAPPQWIRELLRRSEC